MPRLGSVKTPRTPSLSRSCGWAGLVLGASRRLTCCRCAAVGSTSSSLLPLASNATAGMSSAMKLRCRRARRLALSSACTAARPRSTPTAPRRSSREAAPSREQAMTRTWGRGQREGGAGNDRNQELCTWGGGAGVYEREQLKRNARAGRPYARSQRGCRKKKEGFTHHSPILFGRPRIRRQRVESSRQIRSSIQSNASRGCLMGEKAKD